MNYSLLLFALFVVSPVAIGSLSGRVVCMCVHLPCIVLMCWRGNMLLSQTFSQMIVNKDSAKFFIDHFWHCIDSNQSVSICSCGSFPVRFLNESTFKMSIPSPCVFHLSIFRAFNRGLHVICSSICTHKHTRTPINPITYLFIIEHQTDC